MATKTNYSKNGKNYYRVTATIGKKADGKPLRKEFYGKSKKEAVKKRDEYLSAINKGLSEDFNKLILNIVIKEWLEQVVKTSSKPSTYERYEGIYRNYIKNTDIASCLICNIKPLMLQRYYNDLYAAGKSSSVIKNLNKLLKAFFNYCVDNDYILKNPCSGKKIIIPGIKEEKVSKKEIEIFTDNEIKAILTAKEDSLIKYISILSLCTGMRRGECLGLKWNDIDYKNKEINIKRSIKTVALFDDNGNKHYKTIEQSTKNIGSTRTIPLPESLIPILKQLKKIELDKKHKAGNLYVSQNLIFATDIGGKIDDSNLSRSFKRFLKRIGVEHKKFHTLRHTYASKQYSNNIPLKTVQMLLGHSQLATTADTYTHIVK